MAEKILIVGGGAIGGWMSATLSLNDPQNCLLLVRAARKPAHANGRCWMQEITLERNGKLDRVQVRVTADPAVIAEASHIICCLKEGDADRFLLAHEQALMAAHNTTIAFMSSRFPDWCFSGVNGNSDSVDYLKRTLHEAGRIVGFACWVGASSLAPMHVRQDGSKGELLVGALSPHSKAYVQNLYELMRAGGIPVRLRPSILTDMWVKATNSFVWNTAALLTKWNNGQIGSDPNISGIVMQALEEIDKLASEFGIEVRMPAAKRFALTAAVHDHKMSMLQDWERAKPMEYRELYQSFMNCCAAAKIDAPTATIMARLCFAIYWGQENG